jgi:hypothetical protein
MLHSNSNDRAAERFASLSRRRFLRGIGACLALPALPSIAPLGAIAAQKASNLAVTPTGAALRTAFVYFPNGCNLRAWWPKTDGVDYEFTKTLQPLQEKRGMIQLVGGLDHQNAVGGKDGGGDHARGNGVFLTGVRLKKSATDIHAGISIDQVMARQMGHLTRLPSLELSCDAARQSGACDSGYSCAYQYNLSWASPTIPMTPEANPRLVFERLFGSGSPAERAKNLKRRQQEQRSILDFVLDDARTVERQLDQPDRAKLDQYLTGVRELEERIQRAEKIGPARDTGIEAPAGVPTQYEEYVQVMYDLMVLAFQTDSTRVATFLLAHDGSNRSFAEIGIPEGHHDLSHHFDDETKIKKIREIDLWYVKQFSKFLEKMEAVKDTDGKSLLYNSMIVYGGGNADGNQHSHTNLPVVLAGSGGGTLSPGKYHKAGGVPMTNLFLSMADRLNLKGVERFGDSTGRLTAI